LLHFHLNYRFFARTNHMSTTDDLQSSNDPNIKFLQQTIDNMEYELSNASFGGDRNKIPLLMKQLKEARRILAMMTGED